MRGAGACRRRLSAEADRARLPGRGLRAGGGSGRGQEARQQIRRAPRRRASGDAGHDHRGQAALTLGNQLSDGARPHPERLGARLCARLDRYFDRHLPPRRDGREPPARRHPARRAARADPAGHRLSRSGVAPGLRRARPGGGAAARGPVRQRDGRGADCPLLRRQDPRRFRHLLARRACRRFRGDLLCREDPDPGASGTRYPREGERRLDPLHRPGNPRQSRTRQDALRRP
ncbi:hypothetical protein ABIA25_003231 [Sinorhizobium fredii]